MSNNTHAGHLEYTVNEWTSEKFLNLLDEAFTPDVKVVYDLGANVGGWGKVILERFGDKDLYSFEPEEANFKFMSDLLGDKSTNINLGIFYGKKSSVVCGYSDNNVGGYHLKGIFSQSPENGMKDFILEELENFDFPLPDLIKMDVEGSEKNIIENSKVVKDCKTLIIEYHFSDDPVEFFKKHLPEHKIIKSIDGIMFLLKK